MISNQKTLNDLSMHTTEGGTLLLCDRNCDLETDQIEHRKQKATTATASNVDTVQHGPGFESRVETTKGHGVWLDRTILSTPYNQASARARECVEDEELLTVALPSWLQLLHVAGALGQRGIGSENAFYDFRSCTDIVTVADSILQS